MTVSPTDPDPRQLHALLRARLAVLGDPPRLSRIAGGEQVQPFHFAFALFRFAVIFEGIASRAAAGNAVADNAAEAGKLGPAFVRRAVEALDGRLPDPTPLPESSND